jgi:hypothetical protein
MGRSTLGALVVPAGTVVPMVTDATVPRGPIFFVRYLDRTIALIFRFQPGLQMFSPDPN